MVAQYFGDRKVPVVLVIIILVGLIAIHEWADVHYMPFAVAQAADKEQSASIQANRTLLVEHISKYDLNENKKAISLVQDQQFDLQQFVAINGPNQMTTKREDELKRKLVDLKDIKACLINGNQNCG